MDFTSRMVALLGELRREPGVGLGLLAAQAVVDMQHGQIANLACIVQRTRRIRKRRRIRTAPTP